MRVLYWLVSGVFVSLVIVVLSVLTLNMAYVGKANADNTDRAHHASILKIERLMAQTNFDMSRKSDLLRKTRIEFYLREAKQADLRNWEFKRDNLVERAKNILVHHQSQFSGESATLASI